jgi:CheY-like chemotaxis protein
MKNRLLVVEDETELLETIATVLEINDYEVITASTGKQAIDVLACEPVDMVLCDINLPDISGYEVLNYVRDTDATYKTPFVFLTAYSDRQDVRKGMNSGADDYIAKPYSNQELVETVGHRVRLSTLRRLHEMKIVQYQSLSNLSVGDAEVLEQKLQSICDALYFLLNGNSGWGDCDITETMQSIASATAQMWMLVRLRDFLKRNSEKRVYKHMNNIMSIVFLSDVILEAINRVKIVMEDLKVPLTLQIEPLNYKIIGDEGYFEFFGSVMLAFIGNFSDTEKVEITLIDENNSGFEFNIIVHQLESRSKKNMQTPMFEWKFLDKTSFLEMCMEHNFTADYILEENKKTLIIKNSSVLLN